ncbi:phage/plasmid primase, P4 family [Quisquiliibacterium transsilvanicum]|uniref:P4 family phage/plasmid primase-like protein n=1 Tax=Quisquiliibacterium transsilvanicum TaxID=1549638 RepID=A0A7W8M7K7_9BURK|nr:phage/plasmid primase, P4 family [Quisquiliibacterium transsilvanicum]MBB5270325.1 P4 family phage/plasmid primase-like protein [Quisquiliibacterium transsilvanicum]
MNEIIFSAGRNVHHADGLNVVRLPFPDFTRHVLTGAATLAQKDGPYVCGPMRDGRRNLEAALPVAFAALDLDRVRDEIDMSSILEAAEIWRGFGYTTASHKPEAGIFKMRLFFALDREASRDEYGRLCRGIAGRLQALAGAPVEIDDACSKPEQPLYTARAGAVTWEFDGDPVQVDMVLSEVPKDAPEAARPQSAGTAPDWLAQLLDGEDVHANALRVVGRMVTSGIDDATIRATMGVLSEKVAEARGAERAHALMGTELDRLIRGARRKGFAPSHVPEIDGDEIQEEAGDEPAPPKKISQAPIESDIWLAALFAKRQQGRFRWSPGLDWMVNAGTHWQRDETLLRYSTAKPMCAEISRSKGVAPNTRRSIASAKTVNAVLTLARAERGIATPADAWDRDPMVLNTPAGPIDLETGKPLAVVTDRDLFTHLTAAAPDPAMRTPTWLRFTSEIFGNDLEMVEFLQRLAGYCLTGDRREQVLPFFYGTGANGKSVLVDLMLELMGSYALNLPAEALMRQQHVAHPTELAQLRGRRLAVSSELEDGAYWAESRIKSLTGDATLTARFMRQDHFTFKMTQKHIVVGNFKPRLKGDDPAIARRMVLVPFVEKFTGHRCDPLLSHKLRAEYPGILAWMIDGARKWAREGLLIPQKVRDASAEYLNANDDITLWVDECCVTGAAHRTPTAVLYKSFAGWKEANGERPQSVNPWAARMSQRFKPFRTMHVRGFEGIALRGLSEPAYSNAAAKA